MGDEEPDAGDGEQSGESDPSLEGQPIYNSDDGNGDSSSDGDSLVSEDE